MLLQNPEIITFSNSLKIVSVKKSPVSFAFSTFYIFAQNTVNGPNSSPDYSLSFRNLFLTKSQPVLFIFMFSLIFFKHSGFATHEYLD